MPDEKPNEKVVTDLEEALEVGYLGSVPDPTPNEAYTVAGVTSSDEAAKADRRAAAGLSNTPPDLTENPNPQEVEEPQETEETTRSSRKKSS